MADRFPCPKCGHMNTRERRWCKSCKVELSTISKNTELATSAQRKQALESKKLQYVSQGYRIVHEGEFSVQLTKSKEFSFGLAFVGLLFFVLGLLVYLLLYASEKDKSVYLTVDEFGNVSAI